MTIIKIEHELTEEQEKKIMDAINAIVPNDMFCHSSRMSTEVIAAKIWTKADVRGEIENSGHELTEDLLNKTLQNKGEMDQLNDCSGYDPAAYADLVLNGDPETYLKTVTEYKPLD